MLGLRSRAVALALVLAMAAAACGGGDSSTETADDASATDTSAAVDTTDDTAAGGESGTPEEAAPAPEAAGGSDPAAPAPEEGATEGGAPAPPPAQAGGAPAPGQPVPVDDAAALSRVLRVEDMPAGYQQQDESTGGDDDQAEFEESFRRCMAVAGADANAMVEADGEANRTFGKGSANPQSPEGISSGVAGYGDAAAPERMMVELGKLFASEPGRVCIEEEIEKAVAAEAGTAAPGATFDVDAQELNAYKAAGGISQLRLVITVNFGAQKLVFVSDLVIVRAGNFASLLSFTQSNTAFDPKVGQSLVDKSLARLAG